jgi:hypothetical protein
MRFILELGENTFGATDVTRTMTKDHVKAGVVNWSVYSLVFVNIYDASCMFITFIS